MTEYNKFKVTCLQGTYSAWQLSFITSFCCSTGHVGSWLGGLCYSNKQADRKQQM